MNDTKSANVLPLIPAISPGQKLDKQPWRMTTVPPSSARESGRTSNPPCGAAFKCHRKKIKIVGMSRQKNRAQLIKSHQNTCANIICFTITLYERMF